MRKHSFIATAAVALACSTGAFANDPATGKAESRPSATSNAATAAQCESLSGVKKDQCIRQLQQERAESPTASGATSGGGSGAATGATRQNPGEQRSAPAAGANPQRAY